MSKLPYEPKILPLLKSFVANERKAMELLIGKLGTLQRRWRLFPAKPRLSIELSESVLDRLSEAQAQLESEIDVLSLKSSTISEERKVLTNTAEEEQRAFRILAPLGGDFQVRVSAYLEQRTRLLSTGDASVFAALAILAKNQHRFLEALGGFSKPSGGGQQLESEIDVLSFAGTIVENDEQLLGCLVDIRGLKKAA